ncbi:Hypothetical predicted protein, partial [Pelobates cultripes]
LNVSTSTTWRIGSRLRSFGLCFTFVMEKITTYRLWVKSSRKVFTVRLWQDQRKREGK